MKGIHGALLLFGDVLLKIPIVIWIIAFVVMCVWVVKSEAVNGKIALIISMLFYFVMVNYLGIATYFIEAAGLGVVIPILIMLGVPYIATLATFAVLGIMKK